MSKLIYILITFILVGLIIFGIYKLKTPSNKDDVKFKNESLKSDLESSVYIDDINNYSIEKFKKGKEGETWQEALERYKKIYELQEEKLKVIYENYYTTQQLENLFGLKINEKETLERVESFEKTCQCEIPSSLKSLYLEAGTFLIKSTESWGSIQLYSNIDSEYKMPNIGGLVKTIDLLWGGRPEFKESFTDEEINYLNSNYFSFGHYFHDDNVYTHYYFDKSGKFGSITYDQDDFEGTYNDYFKPLLKSSLANQTFDELISSDVDQAIQYFLEEIEES